MKIQNRIIVFLLAVVILLAATSCSAGNRAAQGSGFTTSPAPDAVSSMPESGIDKDRAGNSITLPRKIEKIIPVGPSNTEILVALGCGDKIIATDDYSSNVEGLKAGIPLFSMMTPDGEQIVNLNPDVIFVTGMSKADGDDPFKPVANAGICVVYMPSSLNIEGIKEDIRYMAEVMGVQSRGGEIIAGMEKEIESIKKTGETITDKKTVYFEISAAPHMYSFGNGVFLNELIELAGAENVMGDQESWIAVTDEAVLDANPDVILTSVNYIENPVDEIKSRSGWAAITAVRNGDVYYIDTDASNRPSQNVVKALKEIAKAIYPDKY